MPLDDPSHLDNFRHFIDMGKLAGRIMQVLPEPAGLCAYSSVCVERSMHEHVCNLDS